MSLGSYLEETVAVLLARLAEAGYYPTPVIDLGVLMAHADGQIDREELALLRELFGELLGTRLRGRVAQLMIDASLEVIQQAGVASRLRWVAEILRDCGATEEGVVIAASLALSSGGLSLSERQMLAQLAQACALPQLRLQELIVKVEQQPPPVPVSSRISLGSLTDDSSREL